MAPSVLRRRVCDRSRALSLGRPRHPRHDRRGADARPPGVRPLRDGDRAGRSRADPSRPHRRGEPHEVRLPLRGRGGLGAPPPALPARARAQAARRRPRERHPPAAGPRRGRPLWRRGPDRADGRCRRAAAARGARERQRERPAPPRPLRPPWVAALRDDGDPARRDPDRGVVRRDGGARRHGRGTARRDRDRGDGGRRRPPPLPARRGPRDRRGPPRDRLVRRAVERRDRSHLPPRGADARPPRRRRRHDPGRLLPRGPRPAEWLLGGKRPGAPRAPHGADPRLGARPRADRAPRRQALLARGRGRRARLGADLPPPDAVARAGRLRRGVPAGSRGRAHRPRLGRDPPDPRLVEVAPRHDRAAAPADRHALARGDRPPPARRRPRRPARRHRRRGGDPRVHARLCARVGRDPRPAPDELRASGGVGEPRAASS